MFTVPGGWSLSTSQLKTQNSIQLGTDKVAKTSAENGQEKKKKRKRGRDKNVAVTGENLGELWRVYVEGESTSKKKQKLEKKNNANRSVQDRGKIVGEDGVTAVSKNSEQDERASEEKTAQVTTKDSLTNGHTSSEKEDSSGTQLELTKDPEQPKDPENAKSPDEGRAKYERRKAKAERRRQQRAEKQAEGELPPTRPEASPPDPPPKKSKAKQQSKTTTTQPHPPTTASPAALPPHPTTTTTRTPQTPNLTPLQSKFATKLTSARFRHLNQTLYTTPSPSALALFAATPSAYTAYHAGFAAQVAVWPTNPLDTFIHDISTRAAAVTTHPGTGSSQRQAFHRAKKGKALPATASTSSAAGVGVAPLPHNRKTKTATITDLGCGAAQLAAHFSSTSTPLPITIKIDSFDLHPLKPLVTVADITSLPHALAPTAGTDVAICCLSLMPTNWVGIVDECARIVRVGGEGWVAEVRSRFVSTSGGGVGGGGGGRGRPGDGIGKKKLGTGGGDGKTNGHSKKKKRGQSPEEDDEEVVLPEEEESDREEGKREDFTPFIEVWRRRGFELLPQERGAVERGSKMFVIFRFVRVRDKDNNSGDGGAEEESEAEKAERAEREGRVLRPCLYKTR